MLKASKHVSVLGISSHLKIELYAGTFARDKKAVCVACLWFT